MQRRTGPGWAVNCVEECLSHCKLACVARGLRRVATKGRGPGDLQNLPLPLPSVAFSLFLSLSSVPKSQTDVLPESTRTASLRRLVANRIRLTCHWTRSTTLSEDFLGATDWLPLGKAKADVRKFTIQHSVEVFIERKATDIESNKDCKNICSKAFGLFRHGHVQKIELAADAQCVHFCCLPEMKTT